MVYTNCPWSHSSALKEFLEELLYITYVAMFEAIVINRKQPQSRSFIILVINDLLHSKGKNFKNSLFEKQQHSTKLFSICCFTTQILFSIPTKDFVFAWGIKCVVKKDWFLNLFLNFQKWGSKRKKWDKNSPTAQISLNGVIFFWGIQILKTLTLPLLSILLKKRRRKERRDHSVKESIKKMAMYCLIIK